MIEQEARVVAIEEGVAWVEATRGSACSVSSGRGTSALAKLFESRVNQLRVADPIGVRLGDRVVIGIADSSLTRASLLAYLLPLMLLMGSTLLAGSVGVGEGGSALAGILGLLVGLWLAERITDGARGRERYQPVLLHKAFGNGIAMQLNPGVSAPGEIR